MKKVLIGLFSAAVISVIAACSTTVHSVSSKPDAVVVARTEAPYPDAIWVDNEYRWDGGTYVVVPAHWERTQGVWVPGYWKEVPGGYTWVSGHWK
jgi:hypothetical protein